MPSRNHPLPTRLYLGIADHFPARRSEWVLAGIMVVWGWLLVGPAPVFAQSKAWSQMAAMMNEATWGWLAIGVGAFRLLALIINGTFAGTWYGRWSPHVRALASFLTCFLWFQISFGLWASDAATTGLAVYPGLLVLDAMNIVAAMKDAAGMDKAVSDGR
ncbi:MAG: hypothetical protein J0I42_15125 [Bosea sp.]|uniref:hypothetical protein n=1 Tax=Bosea sp. (in: a-proteobacteria) TaxID=1871050 RepID=UPI001AD40CB0|nr:hypothetical protein [Bosea sp. (in: a-proteobacteria)]MBN9453279.1 hypothetical protein [Bosea sp. (in: a-proteobacteria)]